MSFEVLLSNVIVEDLTIRNVFYINSETSAVSVYVCWCLSESIGM